MNIIDSIKKVIENKIAWKECVGFYIGKTENFEERRFNHTQNDGYTFCWELADGTPEKISKLENSLISYYQKNDKYKNLIDNENKGSAGNSNANILYVAFKFIGEFNINELFEDELQIDSNFPITLS